jgi:hypothetical protein
MDATIGGSGQDGSGGGAQRGVSGGAFGIDPRGDITKLESGYFITAGC